MMKKSYLLIGLFALLLSQLSHAEALKPGPWRFELQTAHAKVPFIVELSLNGKRLQGKLYNGKEVIPLEKITYSGEKISIPLQSYEASLELKQESPTLLKGQFVRHHKNPKIELPIKGTHGVTERFPGEKAKSQIDLSGRWDLSLKDDDRDPQPGVGVFEQKGNSFTGSILTTTGDYRYIEGYVSGNEFEAASFDGVYNYLFKGKVEDGKLKASILAGYKTDISGKKDPMAELPDAYKQTQLEAPLKFSFPNLKGEKVSLSDTRFKGKPVIIQFFGSWCPNCIDEMNYLIPWYKNNHKRGIDIVALAFERSANPAESKKQLIKIQKKFKVPYPLLVAGLSSSDKPEEKIKGLKNFISFPTTIFLNKKHEVYKVHAGFTGPSTGEFFESWKEEFNQTVNELLKK